MIHKRSDVREYDPREIRREGNVIHESSDVRECDPQEIRREGM